MTDKPSTTAQEPFHREDKLPHPPALTRRRRMTDLLDEALAWIVFLVGVFVATPLLVMTLEKL